jgi:hypothetical protein
MERLQEGRQHRGEGGGRSAMHARVLSRPPAQLPTGLARVTDTTPP